MNPSFLQVKTTELLNAEASGVILVDPDVDIDHSFSRIFTAPPVVAVKLRVLEGISGADACHSGLLRCLVEAPNKAVFYTDAVEAVVSAAWQQYRLQTVLESTFGILTVILLCVASFASKNGQPAFAGAVWLGILALHIKRTAEEVVQYLCFATRVWQGKVHRARCLDFDNAADLVYVIVGWFACVLQMQQDELEKQAVPCFCALAWVRALYTLRGESWLGPRLLPILSAIQDTKAIILVTAICTFAATHAYYCLQIRQSPSPLHAVYVAFLQVVRLSVFDESNLGEFEKFYGEDFNISEGDDSDEFVEDEPGFDFDYVWIHGLFHATRIGITILLMNLSIGVLGQNFELYQDQSRQLFQCARARMMWELGRRPWNRKFWTKACKQSPTTGASAEQADQCMIWLLTRNDIPPEGFRSIRTDLKMHMQKMESLIREEVRSGLQDIKVELGGASNTA
ncbi:Ank3 [Symbiodinium sp. CCMP2592]|nr:Ank3 [Symbiodinium sp. CCMP2592]